eukprot:TRINITY_DN12162_c0_g1_i1.p1 TRINITY_DN12162_c0_g1~~TRINITY_DN12162_c0_g1_i1.p1  ORF type:complete len:1451 (-),score=396.76 TRINITY_DN12162_c0_g1_i1:100-4452(-)
MTTPPLINDRFKILKKIGQGGWGTVYKGIDMTNANAVAIKQVGLTGISKENLKSIKNEIKLLQHLSHEKIVAYIDSATLDNFLYIVLEYVENGSLADITKELGRFPEQLIVLYISQVLEGLDYLHSQGVIHRDIKAANILSTKKGGVKVADFGVSTRSTAPTTDASVQGSPYWMAPEIIEMNGASPKSDIWSLGCTVIELLTGKPPYYDLDQMPALFRIVQDDCPPLPDGITPLCKDFLMQCFQKEPYLRQTAAQLLKHRWITSQAKQNQGGAENTPDVKQQVADYAKLIQNVAVKGPRRRTDSAPTAPGVPLARQESAKKLIVNIMDKKNLSPPKPATPHNHNHTPKRTLKKRSESKKKLRAKLQQPNKEEDTLKLKAPATRPLRTHARVDSVDFINKWAESDEENDEIILEEKPHKKGEKKPESKRKSSHSRMDSNDLKKYAEEDSDDDFLESPAVSSRKQKNEHENQTKDKKLRPTLPRQDSVQELVKKWQEDDEEDYNLSPKKPSEKPKKPRIGNIIPKGKKKTKDTKEAQLPKIVEKPQVKPKDKEKELKDKEKDLKEKEKKEKALKEKGLEKEKSKHDKNKPTANAPKPKEPTKIPVPLSANAASESDSFDDVKEKKPKKQEVPKVAIPATEVSDDDDWDADFKEKPAKPQEPPKEKNQPLATRRSMYLKAAEEVSDDGDWDADFKEKSHEDAKEVSDDGDWDAEFKEKPAGLVPKVALPVKDDEDTDSFTSSASPRPSKFRPKTIRKIPAPVKIDLESYKENSDSWSDDPKPSQTVNLGTKTEHISAETAFPSLTERISSKSEGKKEIDGTKTGSFEAFVEDSGSAEEWDDIGGNDVKTTTTDFLEKLARLKAAPSKVVVEDIGDDPFLDIFEDNDVITSMNDPASMLENVKKAHRQEVLREMSLSLVKILEKDQDETVILRCCLSLLEKFREEDVEMKSSLIKNEGVIPIIEMLQLEVKNVDVLDAILRVVNEITEDDIEIQKSVRVMGSIPSVIGFWGPMASDKVSYYPTKIREQTIRFFKNMMRNEKAENSVIRNIIASRALPTVKHLLEPSNSFKTDKEIQMFGIDLIYKILQFRVNNNKNSLTLPIKKNDFCRVWARSELLPSLVKSLDNFNNHDMMDYVQKIAEIILYFSKTDDIVKNLFCSQEVLVPLLDVLTRLGKKPLLDILKAIKDIAPEARRLDSLQKAKAIPVLIYLMSKKDSTVITEAHTQTVLQILFTLLRYKTSRQEEAAKEGVIPYLMDFIVTDSTSKQFALPIILELSRGKKALPFLWENDGVQFYISLFEQSYPWKEQALQSIETWLAEEPDKVIPILLLPDNMARLTLLFKEAEGDALFTIVDSLVKFVQIDTIAQAILKTEFLKVLLTKIQSRAGKANNKNGPNNVTTLVNLVKMLKSLFKASPDRKRFMEEYKLKQLVALLEKESTIFVAQMAVELKSELTL